MADGDTGPVQMTGGKKHMKNNLIYIVIGVVILCIYLVILILFLFSENEALPQNQTQTAAPSPITSIPTPIRPVNYNEKSKQKLLEILSSRPQLSISDQQAKTRILSPFGGESGVIRTTDLYQIEYVQSADEFMVEIKNPNISLVKQEVADWFLIQGISGDGMCILPVVFYLNAETADTLRNLNGEFSPLADQC